MLLGFLLLSSPVFGRAWLQISPIRVQVSLVTVGVRVSDNKGREVHGLLESDFRVFEDDVEQPLSFFSSEEQPVSLCVLMDTSASMGAGKKLSRAREAVEMLLASGHPGNEFLFIPFNHIVSGAREFGTDRGRIERDLENTKADGGTSLYDAIFAGLQRSISANCSRKVMVVITDGVDQNSRHTLDAVVQRLRQSQVQLYIVGYYTQDEARVFRLSGWTVRLQGGNTVDNPRIVFGRLASESGAQAFFPTSGEALRRAVAQIATDLSTQYTLGYYPPNPSETHAFRRIRVEVRPKGLQVRARTGYILSGENGGGSR